MSNHEKQSNKKSLIKSYIIQYNIEDIQDEELNKTRMICDRKLLLDLIANKEYLDNLMKKETDKLSIKAVIKNLIDKL